MHTKNSYFTLYEDPCTLQTVRYCSKHPPFWLFLSFSFPWKSTFSSISLFMSVLLLSNTLIRCARMKFISLCFHLIFYSILLEAFFHSFSLSLSCSHPDQKSRWTLTEKVEWISWSPWKGGRENERRKRTKVILLWHKWPARSVDKRRILMAKSLCLFASLCSFCVQVEKRNAHWIMQCHFMKNERTFQWDHNWKFPNAFCYYLTKREEKNSQKKKYGTETAPRITSARIQLHKCKLRANRANSSTKTNIHTKQVANFVCSKVIWCELFGMQNEHEQSETNNGN